MFVSLCIGHMVGIAASWLVQVGIRIFQFFNSTSRNEDGIIENAERSRILRQMIFIATVRCNASLIFASIGEGIGATLFHPAVGQWIGCVVGDLAGPVIVAVCAGRVMFSLRCECDSDSDSHERLFLSIWNHENRCQMEQRYPVCSTDALLECTIKHMLFLQSITKHADNLHKIAYTKTKML